jgi:hypothetical protein
MMATLGGLALATTWLGSREQAESRVPGPLLIVALCTFRAGRFLAPLVILASLAPTLRRRVPQLPVAALLLLRIALAAVLATYWAHFVWTAMAANAEWRDRVAQWSMVGEWARANTPPDAAFLVPTANGRDAALMLGNTPEPDNVQLGADIFEYASHRRVWVVLR